LKELNNEEETIMTVTERVAYLKGLADGLELDGTSKEGKLFAAIIEVLDDIAYEITDMQEVVGELGDQVDMIDEDLDGLEEYIYDESDDDDDDFDDDVQYEIICPSCNESVFIDEGVLEEGEMICPSCGEKLEFEIDDDVDEDRDQENSNGSET
jgi:uncharacterized protein YbaR (Trm112 family)